jgi:DNA replication protein DnaC
VPELYREADWDRVREPAIREWARTLEARTLRKSDSGVPNWQLLGHGLLLLGPVGTGKSSAAALCAHECAKIGRRVLWSYVPDLADSLADKAVKRTELIRRQTGVDLLIWDDFGVRDLADWEIGYFDQIVESRYRSRRPMIVTTNWTIDDLRADVRLGRLVDRWREMVCSNAVLLRGESMRASATV